MNSTNAPTAKSTRVRWLPRFGLRTLLVATTVIGVGLGYVGMLVQRARHQRSIVAQIEAAGGTVSYDWQFGMGADLERDSENSPNWIMGLEVSGGAASRYRTDSKGNLIERQFEIPHGPRIIRSILGDDIFASVEAVNFLRSDFQPAKEIDPRLLLELPALKVVNLTYGQVNDDWLATIAQLPELRSLALLGYEDGLATSRGLASLRHARQLQTLSIQGEWLRDETVAGIVPLRHLKSLTISSAPQLTSEILPKIGELTDLRELKLIRTQGIDDKHSEQLRRISKLRQLWLIDTSLTDSSLAHVRGFAELESLDLSAANVGDEGMKHVATLPQLRYLRISNAHVGDGGVEWLSRLPLLHELVLMETRITDAGLPTLGRMTQLERLSLSGTSITDCGVVQLGTLRNAQELLLYESQVTNIGGRELLKTLPTCNIFW